MYKSIKKCVCLLCVTAVFLTLFSACENRTAENALKQLSTAKVGETVFFGAYEQDNDTSNGQEPIEWIVLEVQYGKALLISKYLLDYKPYNTFDVAVTWETCTLRSWLNVNFLNEAFSDDEQTLILTAPVSAYKNPHYETHAGKETYDKIFVLSYAEAKNYFDSWDALKCKVTSYAKARGFDLYNGYERWWLRTPGYFQDTTGTVGSIGDIFYADVSNNEIAVRPVLWVDLIG